MTREEMISLYNELTAAEGYILGFTQDHNLYYVKVNHLPDEILRYGRASSKRGGFAKIRVRISASIRKAYIESGDAVLIGSETMLTDDDAHNKGENFERIITETLTPEKWVKDSIPFNVAGDITLNGKQIQIKFADAELTNEKALTKVSAA